MRRGIFNSFGWFCGVELCVGLNSTGMSCLVFLEMGLRDGVRSALP